MNEKKQPTEYLAEAAAESTYQTGSTNPPKSHVGIVSFLLALVIFFCGLSTIFSLMRINLLQNIVIQSENRQCTLAFSRSATPASAAKETGALGFEGQTLTVFWQHYHALPQGVYITRVHSQQPLCTGDVLTSFNGTPVTDLVSVDRLLEDCEPGETVTVTVYRNGKQRQVRLTIYE